MGAIIKEADAWLGRRTRGLLAGICLSLIGLIGVLDHLTRRELASSIFFYLIPISIAA